MRAAIVLSTYHPKIEFLKLQLESLVAQSYRDFVCVVVDDSADKKVAEEVHRLMNDAFAPKADLRCDFQANFGNLGVWHSFEAGLFRAVRAYPEVEFLFLCDQDDVWRENKLEKLIRAFDAEPRAMAVHSDLRVIDAQGKELAPSCWKAEGRSVKIGGPGQLLFRNSITGCAAGFRRTAVELALPFPPQKRIPDYYHDLWLGLCALALGKVVSLPETLVDYRQHSGNVLGAEFTLRPGDAAVKASRASYWKHQWLIRQRAKADFLGRAHGVQVRAMDGLVGRLVRPKLLLGLGFGRFVNWAEKVRAVFRAVRFLGWKTKSLLKLGFKKFQVKFSFFPPQVTASDFLDKKSEIPLCLEREKEVEKDFGSLKKRKLHLFLPSLRPKDIYGGASTALQAAAGFLSREFQLNVYSTEQALTPELVQQLRGVLAGLHPAYRSEAVQVRVLDLADRSKAVPTFGDDDWILVSAWWSAIQAQNLIERLNLKTKQFIYLIQDFEPNFYAWSSDYAGALRSYELDFIPIFNSPSLAAYFKKNGLIPKAAQAWDETEWARLTLAPAVQFTKYFPPCLEKMASRGRVRVLVYGRPKVSRNLFQTLMVGLDLWIRESKLGPEQVEIASAGEGHAPVHLSRGVVCRSLGKIPLEAYPSVLRDFDIGVSLMLSPHPSYPPLEMAASGMLVVSNRFAGKDLSEFSRNFISCDPTAAGVANALKIAVLRRTEYEERIRGSRFIFKSCSEMESVVEAAIQKLETTFYGRSKQPSPHLPKTSPDKPGFQSR